MRKELMNLRLWALREARELVDVCALLTADESERTGSILELGCDIMRDGLERLSRSTPDADSILAATLQVYAVLSARLFQNALCTADRDDLQLDARSDAIIAALRGDPREAAQLWSRVRDRATELP